MRAKITVCRTLGNICVSYKVFHIVPRMTFQSELIHHHDSVSLVVICKEETLLTSTSESEIGTEVSK